MDLSRLRGNERIVEMNVALSGLQGKELQDLAYMLTKMRQSVYEELKQKNEGQNIIFEELNNYIDENQEEPINQNRQTLPKKQEKKIASQIYALQQEQLNHTVVPPSYQINREKVREILLPSELPEMQQDIQFLRHTLVRYEAVEDSDEEIV